jgi:hypothetical protein
MGYEYTDIKDFIEDKGLPAYNLDMLTANLHNDRY